MMLPDSWIAAVHFARTRWCLDFRDRARLEAWQQVRLQRFIREVLPRAPYYRRRPAKALADIPLMDKATMMAEFEDRNTCGIRLDKALDIGLEAERTRDFRPLLGDFTVGLSSGTSGNRGVFLVSRGERLHWAGVLLARALPQHLLGRLFLPWVPALRVAFFMRANSNLYATLSSRRIDFTFHDLMLGVEPAVPKLNRSQPDVLVGPPSLLRALAAEIRAGRLDIAPSHVLSVADVLEDSDRAAIHAAFHVPTHQLYQATEGFLGYTCERGTLHLNESCVHIEPDWLDAGRSRFHPIVTDFSRDTQLIVRYRLNDVLRLATEPCACGRAELAIEAIEGRADEVLYLPARGTGQAVLIYPDLIRRTMLLAGPEVREFDLVQDGMFLTLGLLTEGERSAAVSRVAAEFDALWRTLGVCPPTMIFTDWHMPPPGGKRRRVRRKSAPEGLTCMP
ncbi:MAG: adenylate synthase [Uliginosibacterium sp.]|jgi:putative adenylate-forming enzyme|nr:adenylate synthase [Uliginosibacterium sp.]